MPFQNMEGLDLALDDTIANDNHTFSPTSKL